MAGYLDFGNWRARYTLVLNNVSRQLESYMDLAAARQKLVAANIANASTPGYQAKDIDFQSEFRRALTPGGPRGAPDVIDTPGLVNGNDGNNVSTDREMRMLMENALRFNAASQLWRSQLRQIKMAIESGKG